MTTTEDFRSPMTLAPIRRARERFLADLPLPDGIPDDVVAGWRRARFFGVQRDLTADRDLAAAPASPLLAAASPVLQRLVPVLGDRDHAMVLADERCRVLWWHGRRPVAALRHDLSEREVGHNSAAVALRTGLRAEAHGPEHFLDLWQDVSAVSVPLHAPEGARAVGTVTVVTDLCAGRGSHPGTALAEATAAAVEAELAARWQRPAERLLLDAYLRESVSGQAVVALDGRNRFVNEAAARQLSPEALSHLERRAVALMHGESASDVPRPRGGERSYGLHEPDEARDRDQAQERWGVREPLDVDMPDGSGQAARLTPVRHGDTVIGIIAVARRTSPSPGPGSPGPGGSLRQAGKLAALAGSSVAWRHATARAAELARSSSQPLLLTGERGSGKTAVGRALLLERDGTEPLTVDAAKAPDGRLAALCATLTNRQDSPGCPARSLLLRHAERLGQRDVAALIALLDESPHLPLVITYTPDAPVGPCLQRLLDGLSARSVVLPPLRGRPEDIEELASRLAPEPAPGHPPLTWTLDAVRALEQHSWPGNVTELAHLVRAVAEQRRASGPVRRSELPDAVQERPATRRLSAIERAERDAILEALRRHGGNKARAAAALGIGRATLYRKLRGYR
ncbi:helix-turn-helix domain-containing protein [Streptomyces himalayensis]|nr:helix-turn-helix domain-containing protein [Streptomyces himalayensis]